MQVYVLTEQSFPELGGVDNEFLTDELDLSTVVVAVVTERRIAELWAIRRGQFFEEFELDNFNLLDNLDRRTKAFRIAEKELKEKACQPSNKLES